MIRTRVLALLLCLILAAPVSFAENGALTLEDCYRLALKQSELIAVDAERIREAQARFTQALGTLMPEISFSYVGTREQLPGASGDRTSRESGFVFSQPLFSGFREFAAMSAGRHEKKQRRHEKRRAEQILFTDVADSFYLLMELREDLELLDTVKKALIDRLDELRKREQLGKSRRSEVVSTETQLYIVEDEEQSVKTGEAVAVELLEFLTGVPVHSIRETGRGYVLGPVSEYIASAESRPDVLAAGEAWETARKNVTVAKSDFLPSVSASGNLFTRRASSPRDSDWRALITVDIPFPEVTTAGRVQEAGSEARQSELLFRRAGREAAYDTQSAYLNTRSAFLRAAVLEKAVKSAELSYELQSRDYRANLVSNLDVLSALQSLQDVKRSFNRMYHESRRSYWRLMAASGKIEAPEKQ